MSKNNDKKMTKNNVTVNKFKIKDTEITFII